MEAWGTVWEPSTAVAVTAIHPAQANRQPPGSERKEQSLGAWVRSPSLATYELRSCR